MDRLIDNLRDLDPAAPPSGIDLDAIVSRARRRIAGTRVAVAASLAVLVGSAAFLLWPAPPPRFSVAAGCTAAPHRGPLPTAAPASGAVVPSEPPTETVARLTSALATALRQAGPADMTVLDGETCDEQWTMRALIPGHYVANLDLIDAAGTSRFFARVTSAAKPTEPTCPRPGCTRTVLTDGTVLYEEDRDYGGGALTTQFEAYRVDGTAVTASIDNYRVDQGLREPAPLKVTVTRPAQTLTTEALLRIVRTPSLTLAP